MKSTPHQHLKYQICVSGAAETGHCNKKALDQAKRVGREIALRGAILLNGATTGFPYWAAIGAKDAGGFTVGISPAETEKEHVEKYKLPIDYLDAIIYSGYGYSGRNMLLTRASDAVIIGCGRIGTLNEFTVAFENGKPIGVLLDSGGTTSMIKDILKASHREKDNPKVVFESDPKKLLDQLIDFVKEEKVVKI
ncbi:MAG: hypothetical protein A3C80_02295 [Candidatus Ryanbacteria bacterium RIFCSPHIGHO2_02_FULL_45_43]|uniref:Protein containing YHS domain protein n=1 Tax=Candidatus Ryanbacteria bacterium RIFCSPHIGHO2_01_45_13 TaxID=1802112 RepID=A0A1G2FWH2_9BACT|nr:MAG: hypothetical protein A2718_00725 [Candidatus Ryanbacteria bacterium RIFCSPHIGHO2_01_FULL_44_130]OGZ42436.1 MAG: hypothetical protein A2W41_03570 [Candidatus Ryanbacteria bacterium RIFCSPHIGHO2_01_45_13]OGZ48453.1 MAG: hypothetical protein A3C80_02295 [Candidatus Ryanbacteria bacterium RIFCSPHIGHO2_02_FULL_45_43]OGZ50318.1 MAG: hypothetical protein A3E55_00195 [Candidatus Ryanbacteria bacterium RIFCSPHIGHO2_12_FULL_44_20]OGZ51657.1 MAG: hypothetical protein A3A17_02645 [Candidatus Ryanba